MGIPRIGCTHVRSKRWEKENTAERMWEMREPPSWVHRERLCDCHRGMTLVGR